MNKNDIISAVSIEFGLSRELAERTVNNTFLNVAQSLKKNKVLEIQKFGKFKLTSDKDNEVKSGEVRFAPSKKLSVRVNSKFDNLKKIKLKLRQAPVVKDTYISTTEIKEELTLAINSEINSPEKIKDEKINIPAQRKLISDDLVKLHKEITKEDKDESGSANNLWG